MRVRSARPPHSSTNEVLCGLGRSIASTGKLGAESVERAIAALTRFRAIARVLRVKNLKAFATAAVRDASDGRAFLPVVSGPRQRIELLSGEREAALGALGIIMGFGEADGVAGDLGGGSLELVDIHGRRRRNAMTLPLGGLRLIDTPATASNAPPSWRTRRSPAFPGSTAGAARSMPSAAPGVRSPGCTCSTRTILCT